MNVLLEVKAIDVYYGVAQALSEVSLQLCKDEIVTLVGANGAGKSSLIRAIAGMEPCRKGQIFFAGREITDREPHEICNLGIGQVPEARQLFSSLSVLENLEMGALLPRARANAKQSLDEVLALFPRLGERRKQIAGTLSGGEQQMLAVGRCLMSRPELIMLDEPSLGLAPAVVQELFRVIGAFKERGIAVFLVEQNVAASLKMSDRAYVLENGRIVMNGSAAELLNDDRVRQAYLGL
jgi:branched-chain amino acid transport system ATP-binding protein